jgi:hypothetical protein
LQHQQLQVRQEALLLLLLLQLLPVHAWSLTMTVSLYTLMWTASMRKVHLNTGAKDRRGSWGLLHEMPCLLGVYSPRGIRTCRLTTARILQTS